MGIRLDENRPISSLEQMPRQFAALIKPVGEAAVQAMHPGCDVRLGSLEEKVIVVGHKAVRVATPPVSLNHDSECVQEELAVATIEENALTPIPARSDVV